MTPKKEKRGNYLMDELLKALKTVHDMAEVMLLDGEGIEEGDEEAIAYVFDLILDLRHQRVKFLGGIKE